MDEFRFIKLLESILESIWSVRCLPADCCDRDWQRAHASASAEISLGFNLGFLTFPQSERCRKLLSNAAVDNCSKPFPSPLNAGPVISWYELHKRQPEILQLRAF